MLACPFCGAPETDRVDLDGSRFLVFRCMFTPKVDPSLADEQLTLHLREVYGSGGSAYFRGMCDTLHLHVSKGEGARVLTNPRAPATPG